MLSVERLATVAVLVTAFVCIFLASSGVALADYCQWQVNCVLKDPDDPSKGWDCEITSYFCSPFSGDCDQACDQEYANCVTDCVGEGGSQQDCDLACDTIYVACIGSCIPNI